MKQYEAVRRDIIKKIITLTVSKGLTGCQFTTPPSPLKDIEKPPRSRDKTFRRDPSFQGTAKGPMGDIMLAETSYL